MRSHRHFCSHAAPNNTARIEVGPVINSEAVHGFGIQKSRPQVLVGHIRRA